MVTLSIHSARVPIVNLKRILHEVRHFNSMQVSSVLWALRRIQRMICLLHKSCGREANMVKGSDDTSVLGHIDQLVKEEERLYGQSELEDKDRTRLAQLKVELDQCWDLLRQRRALREFGEDPDKAKVRPAKIVENYEQ